MKKLALTIIMAFYFSISGLDNRAVSYKQPVPIVYKLEANPVYLRKRYLRRHFIYE